MPQQVLVVHFFCILVYTCTLYVSMVSVRPTGYSSMCKLCVFCVCVCMHSCRLHLLAQHGFLPASLTDFLEEQWTKGSSLTRKQRIEITEVIAYRILAHTEFPTSAEYNAVCQALVAKFPTTSNSIGTGYVNNFSVSLNSCVCLCVCVCACV